MKHGMYECLFHSAKESREFNLLFIFNTFYFIRWFFTQQNYPFRKCTGHSFLPFFFLIKNYKIRKLCLWIITDSSIKKNMILHNKTSVEYWTEFSDAEFHIRENRFNNSAAMYARGKQRSGTIVLSISLKLPVYSVQ